MTDTITRAQDRSSRIASFAETVAARHPEDAAAQQCARITRSHASRLLEEHTRAACAGILWASVPAGLVRRTPEP